MPYLNHFLKQGTEEQETYLFRRVEEHWFLVLPKLMEHGFNEQDLEITEGAHKLLNCLSKGASKLRLRITGQPVEKAGVLELMEHCPAPKGGAIYLFTPFENSNNWNVFWICDLALLIFGDVPPRIFLQRLPVKLALNKTPASDA